MKYPKIINRNKMQYVVYEDKVVAFVGAGQWISYNKYDNWNKQGITMMANKLIKSKDTEYSSPSALLTLAHDCRVIGSSTGKPKDIQ